jgi:hypothetical protein
MENPYIILNTKIIDHAQPLRDYAEAFKFMYYLYQKRIFIDSEAIRRAFAYREFSQDTEFKNIMRLNKYKGKTSADVFNMVANSYHAPFFYTDAIKMRTMLKQPIFQRQHRVKVWVEYLINEFEFSLHSKTELQKHQISQINKILWDTEIYQVSKEHISL